MPSEQEAGTVNRLSLPLFFSEDDIIRLHCTNEEFTGEKYSKANCE